MNQYTIALREFITKTDYAEICALEALCGTWDGTALKLELDYKLAVASENARQKKAPIREINAILYYLDSELIAYMGIDCFGGAGSDIEVNGMVHPAHRRQGIFKQMSKLVVEEWRRRDSGDLLLLCDRNAEAGQSFIKSLNLPFHHAEYEMYLNSGKMDSSQIKSIIETSGIVLRKATNQDAKAVAKQNAIYFGEEASEDENDWIMPETEEKRGMTIYMAMLGDTCIGKVHLQLNDAVGGIFGLGVLPDYRGKGSGRAILLDAVEKLKAIGAQQVMLQVAAENAKALTLYESSGFESTSTMDYFVMKRL